MLEAHADHANALQARSIAARRLSSLGRLDEATATRHSLDARALAPAQAAQAALARAHEAASRARVPALLAEVATRGLVAGRSSRPRSGRRCWR